MAARWLRLRGLTWRKWRYLSDERRNKPRGARPDPPSPARRLIHGPVMNGEIELGVARGRGTGRGSDCWARSTLLLPDPMLFFRARRHAKRHAPNAQVNQPNQP